MLVENVKASYFDLLLRLALNVQVNYLGRSSTVNCFKNEDSSVLQRHCQLNTRITPRVYGHLHFTCLSLLSNLFVSNLNISLLVRVDFVFICFLKIAASPRLRISSLFRRIY